MNWRRLGQTDRWWISLAAALALTTGTAIGWALLRPRAVISTVPLPPVTLTPSPPVIGALLPAQSRPGLVLVPPTIPARVAQTAPGTPAGTRSTPPRTRTTAPVTPSGTRKSTPGGARSTPTAPVPGPVSVAQPGENHAAGDAASTIPGHFHHPASVTTGPGNEPGSTPQHPASHPHGTRFRATSHPPSDHPSHHASVRGGQPGTRTDMNEPAAHATMFHFVKQPRYYAAVDEIREAHTAEVKPTGSGAGRDDSGKRAGSGSDSMPTITVNHVTTRWGSCRGACGTPPP